MFIDTLLQDIGGFHRCDESGTPKDGSVHPRVGQIARPFAVGMLTMSSAHGEFKIKRLSDITYVSQAGDYWVCFEAVTFEKFTFRGCALKRVRA